MNQRTGSSLKAAGQGIMGNSNHGGFNNSHYGRDTNSSKNLNYGMATTAGGATYITEVPNDMGPTREQLL